MVASMDKYARHEAICFARSDAKQIFSSNTGCSPKHGLSLGQHQRRDYQIYTSRVPLSKTQEMYTTIGSILGQTSATAQGRRYWDPTVYHSHTS